MGTCLSKKKGSSTSSTPLAGKTKSASTASAVSEVKNSSGNAVTVSKPKVETEPEVKLKKDNNTVQVQEKHESLQEDAGHVKKEIFIIKHRKSHDDRERNSKSPPNIAQQNLPQQVSSFEESELMGEKNAAAAAATNIGVGVRTSSCTKEEVDAILIHCGRLSRSSSSAAAASSSGEKHRRKYSGSKRSFDFDHCDNDNDTISTDEDQKKVNANHNNTDFCEESRQHRPRRRHSPSPRPSSQERRRRTPSREREQQQQPSSRERRVSRSPGRRSSETTTSANARNNSSNNSSRPGKMVSVPATVSSLVMDKSNNGGSGGGDSAATTGIKRITVKRNVGTASPRSQSPARANGNVGNGNKALGENQQQQPSLSRNNSRKAEQSPYRRNPLSELDPNSLAFPHSTASSNSSRVQNRPRKELETESNQKPNGGRTALDKGVSANYKTKVQQEEDVKVHSSMTDNVVVKTVIPSEFDNLKPQALTRSRSSRRSRDFDLNPDAPLIPPQSYTSLLLEDIQNFHQKNTPSVPLPACVTKACSILEAVADLNSNTNSNFQPGRNEHNIQFSTNSYGNKELDANEPVVESMVFDNNDDVMEPSLHKYVTVNRGGSVNGVDMEDQESSGSNSYTVSSGQNHWGISNSSWEPNSVDSKDCWTSRMNYTREEGQKNPLGLGLSVEGAKEKLISKRRECDHEHASGIGSSRLGSGTNKVIHTVPIVTAAAST